MTASAPTTASIQVVRPAPSRRGHQLLGRPGRGGLAQWISSEDVSFLKELFQNGLQKTWGPNLTSGGTSTTERRRKERFSSGGLAASSARICNPNLSLGGYCSRLPLGGYCSRARVCVYVWGRVRGERGCFKFESRNMTKPECGPLFNPVPLFGCEVRGLRRLLLLVRSNSRPCSIDGASTSIRDACQCTEQRLRGDAMRGAAVSGAGWTHR